MTKLGTLRMSGAHGVDDGVRSLLGIAVDRAVQTGGGTLDVLYMGLTLILQLGAGETIDVVEQRLIDAIDEAEGWCASCGLRHRVCKCADPARTVRGGEA